MKRPVKKKGRIAVYLAVGGLVSSFLGWYACRCGGNPAYRMPAILWEPELVLLLCVCGAATCVLAAYLRRTAPIIVLAFVSILLAGVGLVSGLPSLHSPPRPLPKKTRMLLDCLGQAKALQYVKACVVEEMQLLDQEALETRVLEEAAPDLHECPRGRTYLIGAADTNVTCSIHGDVIAWFEKVATGPNNSSADLSAD